MEAPMAQARADVMPQMDSAPPLYFPKEDVPPRSPMTAMSLPSNPPIPGGPGPSPLTQSRESTSAPSMLPEPELQQAPLASASTPSSMPVREVQAKESGGVLEKLQFWKKPAPTPQSERYVPVGNQQPMMPDGLQPMTAPTGNIAVTDAPMPRTNNVAPLTPIAGAQPSPSQEVSDGALMSQMGMEPSSDAAIQLRAPGGPAMESAGIPESRYATRRARNHRDSY
jgi:hypothetical protein